MTALTEALDSLPGGPATLTVLKSRSERLHTFGPVFFDGVADDPGTAQERVWALGLGPHPVTSADGERVGSLVEVGQWPFPQEATVGMPGGNDRVLLKAGTVYAGIRWETPDDFTAAREGRYATGLSLGGSAISVFDLEA